MSKLPIGISSLDRELEGGIPDGYILSIISPSASDSERLIYQILNENSEYQPIYFTTEKSESFLEDTISRLDLIEDIPQIVDLTAEKEPLDEMDDYFKKIPDQSIVVIDSIDPLEFENRHRYQNFLNNLQEYMAESESLAIIYGTSDKTSDTQRPLTMKMSDAVFEIEIEKQSEEIISHLSITKFRGIDSVSERNRLQLNVDEVSIDTSRDIA